MTAFLRLNLKRRVKTYHFNLQTKFKYIFFKITTSINKIVIKNCYTLGI